MNLMRNTPDRTYSAKAKEVEVGGCKIFDLTGLIDLASKYNAGSIVFNDVKTYLDEHYDEWNSILNSGKPILTTYGTFSSYKCTFKLTNKVLKITYNGYCNFIVIETDYNHFYCNNEYFEQLKNDYLINEELNVETSNMTLTLRLLIPSKASLNKNNGKKLFGLIEDAIYWDKTQEKTLPIFNISALYNSFMIMFYMAEGACGYLYPEYSTITDIFTLE